MTILGAGSMPAAGIVNPTIDVAGQFQQGRQDAAQNTANDMANQAQQIEMLASGALHAMPQGPNGPVDPAKWNEVLDTFEATGMPPDKVKAFRDHPEIASVVLKGSVNALKAQYDAASFERSLKLLDAQIGQALSATEKNLAGPTPTDDQRELAQINAERTAKGLTELGMEEFLSGKSGGGMSVTMPDGTTMTMGGKGANAYDVEDAKAKVKLASDIAAAGRTATDQKSKLGKMRELLSSDGVYTGIGSDQVLALQRFAKLFGIGEGVQDTESFNALTKAAVLDKMGGSLGTGVSNADRDYIDGQVPSLQNTKDGNLQLIDITEKLAQRQIDVAKFAAEYKKAHGGRLDYEFDDALATWAEQNPMFPADGDQPTGGASEAPPPGAPGADSVEETQTIDGVKYVKRGGKWFTAD